MDFHDLLNDPSKHILVIGAGNLDIVSISTQLIDEQNNNMKSHIRTCFGGVSRNVAENLARLGESVNFVTVVGDDDIGHQLLKYTSESGVNIDSCIISEGKRTGSYIAIYDKNGQLQYSLEDMELFKTLTTNHLRLNQRLFEEAKMVFFDANLPVTTIKTIFSLAKKAKIPVCADATSISLAQKLDNYLDKLYLLTANANEAGVICQKRNSLADPNDSHASARFIINSGTKICVIPMAEFGVSYATSETSGSIPAMRTKITDPTGAGDALTATIIYGIVNNIPLDDSIRLGVTAASLTLRYTGTVYPGLSVERLYEDLVI